MEAGVFEGYVTRLAGSPRNVAHGELNRRLGESEQSPGAVITLMLDAGREHR